MQLRKKLLWDFEMPFNKHSFSPHWSQGLTILGEREWHKEITSVLSPKATEEEKRRRAGSTGEPVDNSSERERENI